VRWDLAEALGIGLADEGHGAGESDDARAAGEVGGDAGAEEGIDVEDPGHEHHEAVKPIPAGRSLSQARVWCARLVDASQKPCARSTVHCVPLQASAPLLERGRDGGWRNCAGGGC
jgi:hypothetical protein